MTILSSALLFAFDGNVPVRARIALRPLLNGDVKAGTSKFIGLNLGGRTVMFVIKPWPVEGRKPVVGLDGDEALRSLNEWLDEQA